MKSPQKTTAVDMAGAPSQSMDTPTSRKMRLVREVLRPYRGWIVIILLAMLVETAMSLAAPWPLKVILDNVVGTHKAPEWLDSIRNSLLSDNKLALAAVAGIATVLIAALGAVASYIDNYYTESVGQWVAHDLRMRVYDHLQHLSLGYYDSHQTGALLSTITDDIKTIQGFASSSTLDIFTDLLTIIGMFGLMLWMEFDFALIAVGVSPFLLLFVARLNRVVKRATHEVRHHQSDIVAVVEQGLESIRVVKAFGRQELEESRLYRREPRYGGRRAPGPAGEVAPLAGSYDRGRALHGLCALARHCARPRQRDDGGRANRLPRLSLEVLQAGTGPREDEQHPRPNGSGDGACAGNPRHPRHGSRAPRRT